VRISIRIARRAVGTWRNRKHLDCWKPASQIRHAEISIVGQSLYRKNALLKLSRPHLRWVINLLTGHNLLRGHLKKL
jgi:hypothetical protein